jgi:hypothetical protein
VLKSDLSTLYLAGSKDISAFDIEKGTISSTVAHGSDTLEHLALDPNLGMLTYVSGRKEVKILDKKSNKYFWG